MLLEIFGINLVYSKKKTSLIHQLLFLPYSMKYSFVDAYDRKYNEISISFFK